ncbi:DUF3253 domain-containing protein [Pseudarthrobacter chlorophenolicus]|uniref:DUF3253 domain-containing protein n=1 Tax=Pseudarthrobacter chlorophenolicus TaxID=85085 RepID=UPI000B25341D|nr:DUF3253 domain-containing protein [Pseudarthrobacter chlorophenolicus]
MNGQSGPKPSDGAAPAGAAPSGKSASGPSSSGPTGQDLEAAILKLLAARAATSTICPSDAARAVGGEHWRGLMEPVRQAARRLVDAGDVEVTQGGSVVDPATAKGPIRIRKAR